MADEVPAHLQTLRSRYAAILFADLSGSTKLYETVGDTIGQRTVRSVVEMMKKATEGAGGRVVKTIGDEVLAVFSTAGAAAAAAVEMQKNAETLPEVGGKRLQLRIGFHGGPVLQKENDVFGDTVNLAARLAKEAQAAQIICSRQTATLLQGELKDLARDLYGVKVKGKSEEIDISEIVWKKDEDRTVLAGPPGKAKEKPRLSVLRLKYRDLAHEMRREQESETIGRDPACRIPIADHMASRRHCTIERRGDLWVLKDHSTNGTFATLEGDAEVVLQREELTLRRHGWICCGQTRASTEEVVEFFIE